MRKQNLNVMPFGMGNGRAGFWWTRHVSIAALSSNSPKHCKSAGTFTLRQDCINLHSCGASEYDGTIFSGLPSTNEACSLERRKTTSDKHVAEPQKRGKRHPPVDEC